jgi:hypothetical protein
MFPVLASHSTSYSTPASADSPHPNP